MRILIAAVAAIASTVMFAATAHADPGSDDAYYLKRLHGHGISSVDGDADLIADAHYICRTLSAGTFTIPQVVAEMELGERPGFSDANMQFMVQTAAAAYCPEYIR